MDVERRFWSKVDKRTDDECWPWTRACFSNGYGAFRLENKQVRAHRVAYTLVNGLIPDGLQVRHTCDNPPCCNPRHLLVGTMKDNIADAIARGRLNRERQREVGRTLGAERLRLAPRRRGEQHPRAKLTPDLVREIRRRYAAGNTTQHALAATLGLNRATVASVLYGQTWGHIVG